MKTIFQKLELRALLSSFAVLAAFVAVTVALSAPSAAIAAGPTACPSSHTLTSGSQTSYQNAVLYCGGTYSDTWTADNQEDWIAFYTTVPNASVILTTTDTGEANTSNNCVVSNYDDPNSNTTQAPNADNNENQSIYGNGAYSDSYTFANEGLHYVFVGPCYDTSSTSESYSISLAGQWSQTPPTSSTVSYPPQSTTCPSSTTLTPGNQTAYNYAALYCGGTYSDTWNADDEEDWIAFYTTVPNASVILTTTDTGEANTSNNCVVSNYDDPNSNTTQAPNADNNENQSIYGNGAYSDSYTFANEGLHYVFVGPCYDTSSTSESYSISLAGQWSQTPPTSSTVSYPPQSTTCPSSTTLTPGNQTAYNYAALYCGGTYSDTWNADDEEDWIAFYTTVPNASVILTTTDTGEANTSNNCVVSNYDDANSNTTQAPNADNNENQSIYGNGPSSDSYTFPTAGLHYVFVGPCYDTGSTGESYSFSLSGAWSQTPPASKTTTSTSTTPTKTSRPASRSSRRTPSRSARPR